MARKKSTQKNTREKKTTTKAGRKLVGKAQRARFAAPASEPATPASVPAPAPGTKHYRSGSEFVREQPPDKPTRQVVEQAEQYGLKVTPNLVRIVRFKMRHEGEPRLAGGGRRTRLAMSGRRGFGRAGAGALAPGALGQAESRFRSLVLQLGTARARALLSDIDRLVQSLT